MLPSVALIALLAATLVPATSVPPIKMGLWESTSTPTYTGDGAPPSKRIAKMRRCITTESWLANFQGGPAQSGCERSNEVLVGGHYTADLACSTMHAAGKIDMNFPSAEAGHGNVHIQIDMNGHKTIIDTAVEMHFISESCGSVTPDHPLVLQ